MWFWQTLAPAPTNAFVLLADSHDLLHGRAPPQITVRSSPITHTHSDQLSVCRHCHKHCKSRAQHSPVSLSTSLQVQHSQATTSTSTPTQRRCCQSPTPTLTPHIAKPQPDCNASLKSASSSSSSSKASQSSQLSSSQPSTLTGSCTMNAQLITRGDASDSPAASAAGCRSRPADGTEGARTALCLHRHGHCRRSNDNDHDHGDAEPHSHRQHHQQSRHHHHHHQHCPHHASALQHDPDRQQPPHTMTSSHDDECELISSSEPPSMTSSCESEAPLLVATVGAGANQPPVKPERFALQRQLMARRSTPELRKETCKLVENSCERYRSHAVTVERPAWEPGRTDASRSDGGGAHKNCRCNCSRAGTNSYGAPSAAGAAVPAGVARANVDDDVDDWSMMLIGLAQLQPATALVQMDPFKALPSIAVVPPTPTMTEGLFSQFCGSPNWSADMGTAPPSVADRNQAAAGTSDKPNNGNDDTPQDSPQDEEPPYRSLNTSLKRYGTMSSLERFSSEDVDEAKTLNSSEEDVNDADSKS